MHGTRAAVLRAHGSVLVPIGCRVGQVSLAGKMHQVLGNLARSGDQSPEQEHDKGDRLKSLHPGQV